MGDYIGLTENEIMKRDRHVTVLYVSTKFSSAMSKLVESHPLDLVSRVRIWVES